MESRCTATEDLRVGDPFPALRTWVDSFDLADAERMKRVRIPSLVLLIKVLDAWKTEVCARFLNMLHLCTCV
ncbi:hypothetical protein EON66_11440 [archaeon]|nr:MAG: hypothetical protein EON66_11440 [archaeon]